MPVTYDVKALSGFLQGQLTIYDRTFYQVPEADLWGATAQIIPTIPGLRFGIEEIQSFRQQFVGEASVTDGVAMDIPLVDFGIASQKVKAMGLMAGAEWTMSQLERQQIANANIAIAPVVSVVESKLTALNLGINRRIHRLSYMGFSEAGFEGMLNSTKYAVIDATAEGNLYGATTPMTPTALTDWFQAKIAAFKTSSRLAYNQIVIYVDDNLYTALCRPIGDNTGDTPYMRLTSAERGRFCKDIRPMTELAPQSLQDIGVLSAGQAATRGRILLGDWDNRESALRYMGVIDRTDPFPKDTGVHFGVTGWAAISEIDYKVPERFSYINFAHT